MEKELRMKRAVVEAEKKRALKEDREEDFDELQRRLQNTDKILNVLSAIDGLKDDLIRVGSDAIEGMESGKVFANAMHTIVWKVANITSSLE